MATYTAHQCEERLDDCRGTRNFPHPGQNVGLLEMRSPTVGARVNHDVIEQIVFKWFMHYLVTSKQLLANYSTETAGTAPLPFVTMMNQETTDIGCALARWTLPQRVPAADDARATTGFDGRRRQALLVCNYSQRNEPGRPVFEAGAPCDCLCNAVWFGLCRNSNSGGAGGGGGGGGWWGRWRATVVASLTAAVAWWRLSGGIYNLV